MCLLFIILIEHKYLNLETAYYVCSSEIILETFVAGLSGMFSN